MKLSNTKVLGLLGLSLLVACTKVATKDSEVALISDAQNIVSTRGSDEDQFFALIKLKNPALLEKSKRVNGVTVIDQALKAKIEAEQAQTLSELKKLSANVQVIYRYKMVLNAIAVVGPREIFDKISAIGLIANWEKVTNFERSIVQADTVNGAVSDDLKAHNSSKFIGAEELHKLGITGQGMRIGVLDTGIDYTHAMFGGAGTPEAFKAIDPSTPNAAFPSAKVVGGVDLVGTDYNAASAIFSQHIPKPDLNPIDEAAHGSHVAGTIAGHGDGVNSYDGMAPDASLYAVKVFGAKGSTSDMIVIAGLEFAADPNGDGILDDQLDVVNLSLGSSYGGPKSLYSEAIKNIVRGGTGAVISAGNAGNVDYIVGSPGATTEALTVAASLDDTQHNWIFASSKIMIENQPTYVIAVEAATTKPIEENPVVGNFYYIGVADKDLTPDQIAGLTGKVALIDRGAVNFNDKIKRAVSGGAIGVVMLNNQPGEPIVMGTTDKFDIPAIMVSLEIGNQIKSAMKANASAVVGVEFLGDKNIEKPELIDTIASFSSKGPRSVDGFLKPEISAPGYNIISADIGTGSQVVQMSGTSMAAPHMTGVMALLKQGTKQRGLDLSALELKNLAMGHAKTISENGVAYPVTRQGSGRVQATMETINSVVVADVPSLAFGETNVSAKKTLTTTVNLKNLSGQDLSLSFVFEGHPGVQLKGAQVLKSAATKDQSVKLSFELDASLAKKDIEEMGGLVKVMMGADEVYRLPFLAVIHKVSDLSVTTIKTAALSGAKTDIVVRNRAPNKGEALFFNALSLDGRKVIPQGGSSIFNTECDLQSAGYRIVEKKNDDGSVSQMIQFAVKTYRPMTIWNYCDVSILFDADGDGKFEQELVATNLAGIPGQKINQNASVLMDAVTAQQIRKSFEAELKAAGTDPEKLVAAGESEDYTAAIVDVQDVKFYSNSTLAVLQADVSALAKDKFGNLNFKILTTYYAGSTSELDDYLQKGKNVQGSYSVPADLKSQPFYGFEASMLDSVLDPLSMKSYSFAKSKNAGDLVVYYPQNEFTLTESALDKQQQIVK